jgi:hypothetical protein
MPITIDQVDVEVLPPDAPPTSGAHAEVAVPSFEELQRLLQLRAERAARVRAQ